MKTLGTLVGKGNFSIAPLASLPPLDIPSLVASVWALNVTGQDLGSPKQITAALTAWLYQDDDAHDTCSLTACLNPLHPGPCKGWKHSLFKSAPNAWHALEAARVDKANATRVKKIEHLKAKGLPIPKKLLTPILPKPHPHAGQTANSATGEAHEAGKAVTESAGIHVNTPGKVTLGQAVKKLGTDATAEKGPKGKKPTVMSKGIATVIAQEKVTPQYKLDKAATITPEQWSGLTGDEKSVIRGELAKIQKDGFGPQQKKATELLDKLPAAAPAKLGAPKAADAGPSGSAVAAHHIPKVPGEPLSAKNYTPAMKDATDAAGNFASPPNIHALQMSFADRFKAYQKINAEEWKALPEGTKTAIVHDMINASAADSQLHQGFIDESGKAYTPASAWLKRRNIQLPALDQGKIDKFVPQFAKGKPTKPTVQTVIPEKTTVEAKNIFGEHSKITKVNHPKEPGPTGPAQATPKLGDVAPAAKKGGSDQHGILNKPHVGGEVKSTTVGLPSGYKLSKDSMGYILTYKHKGSVFGPKAIRTSANQDSLEEYAKQHAEAVKAVVAKHEAAGTSPTFEVSKLTPEKVAELAKSAKQATPHTSDEDAAKQAHADKVAAAKPLPAHVQHAIDMANGHAPGASWSKNHLAAYQKLTPEEYKAFPPDVQAKVKSELEKGQTKFLDPKKVQATKDLLAKFKGASPSAHKIENKPEAPKEISFQQHLNDHSVTQAQAKEVVDKAPLTSLFAVAKHSAGVTDMENPDNPDFIKTAEDGAKSLIDSQTKLYTPAVLDSPAVKAAIEHSQSSVTAELHARLVDDAAKQAFNKVSKKLHADGSPQVTAKLSPIQAAALKKYQQHLVGNVAKADIDALTEETKKASADLDAALHKAAADANAPSPANMTGAQLDSKVKELLGSDVVDPTKPQVSPSLADMQNAKKAAAAETMLGGGKYPVGVLTHPEVAAKQAAYLHAVTQLNATQTAQKKLNDHIHQLHENAILSGKDHQGNPISKADKQIIALHAVKLANDYKTQTSQEAVQQAQAKAEAAKEQFHAAAEKAAAVPHEPVKLSDYDQTTISTAFSGAWNKHASKAVTYGVDYPSSLKMKAHPEYAQLTQDLGNLKDLAGKVALAHAAEHTAKLNVPTDPDTGDLEHGPEWDAWKLREAQRVQIEKEFNAFHKTAQERLDEIRVAAGLKKRALPKIDSPAVKATAAEAGYYKTGGHGGPNYGKAAAAKSYMLAKVGDKLGVQHQTTAEKKAAKAATLGGTVSAKTSAPTLGTPVPIGSDSSITGIPDPLKKQITSDFKDMPSGKYLADPASDIFDNLVTLAAAHGKDLPNGLSVDQVLKTIDETHSKNLGVANSGMLHQKITEWLGTPAGKSYAEAHSAPDPKKVKQLTGELDLPKGVTLAPGEKVQKVAGPGPHDESLGPDVFKKASTVSAQVAQDQYMKDNGIKWSAQQKAALKSYTGSAYHTYNGYLRGNGSANASAKQDIIDIQSAMMPLAQHTLLKRGTGWDALPAEYHGFENAQKLLGKSFVEPGFTSTTVAGESGHFGGPLQLEIEAPEGTAAAFVNNISHYKNQENEMLLAAGTKFKVLSVTQKGHQTVMRVRIVGDK